MTRRPFGPQDRAWLLSRLFVLGLVLFINPLPFDLRKWGVVIPAYSAQSAYVVFECLQTAVFAAALFYGDMLPGMRWAISYYRWLTAEIREAPFGMTLIKAVPFALGLGTVVWLILFPVGAAVDAVPAGLPRFFTATAFFIVDRLAVTLTFIIVVNASDDDDEPGLRRRSIAQSAKLLLAGRVRVPARANVTTMQQRIESAVTEALGAPSSTRLGVRRAPSDRV